jgi:hypothetical protein
MLHGLLGRLDEQRCQLIRVGPPHKALIFRAAW